VLAASKRCGRCEEVLPLGSFNRLGDGHQHWCRDCFRAYFRSRSARHLEQARASKSRQRRRARAHVLSLLLGESCVDCGEHDVLVLEFDHVGTKRRGVASLVDDGAPTARIDEEIDECQVVCVNCHRRRTSERRSGGRRKPTSAKRPKLRNQALVRSVLERSSCVDCGEPDPRVLEFDHVGAKRHNVSDLVCGGYSLRVLAAELAECELRCANCHRRRTARSVGNYRSRSTMRAGR
jgi:5-methylcytosine-specific restriction endonuclease McrA